MARMSTADGKTHVKKTMKSNLKTDSFEIVESAVLKMLIPSKTILPSVNLFIQSLTATVKKLKLDCRIVVGGSVAKNTHLADDFDCDLFVRFNPGKYGDDKIAAELKKLVEAHRLSDGSTMNLQLLHGSRDYYKTIVDGITYELVPTLDIAQAKDAPNITDMSLFHVDWTVAHCKKNPILADQIRLAKAFCKAQNVYGAESYIGGLSGHVLDILVVSCGSFHHFLERSLTWNDKHIIDVEHFYEKKDALTQLNEAKLTSPIIVVDPIVSTRNAASALSSKCFEKFKVAAAAYLENPSASFFVKKTFDVSSLNYKKGTTYAISVIPLSDKKDIAGAQHVKVLEYVVEQAKLHEFDVVGNGWTWDENQAGTLYVRVATDELSSTTTVRGPPTRIAHAVDIFKSIHKKVVEKDGQLWATVQRKYSHFGSLLDALANHDLITIRCKEYSWKKLK